MYTTLFRILLATLGAAHPLVKRMKSKIDDVAKKGKDDKVLEFPSRGLEEDVTSRAFEELDIQRANKKQLDDFIKELEPIVEMGPDRFNKLNMENQGTVFRNVKRFERKTLQDPSSREGVASLDTPQAPVFKIGSGEEMQGEGLASLQKKFGLPEGSPGPRESKVDEGIINLKRNVAETQQSAQELLDDADRMSKARARQGGDEFPNATLGALQDKTQLRGVARQFIIEDIKSGRLKNLSPGMKEGMLNPTGSGLDGDPLDVLFRYYGADAFEVLDELTKKHGATIDGIDLIKLDLKNKVGVQPDFELKPRDFPMSSLGGKEGKIPLTQREVVEFLTGTDKDGNPISKEKLKFYNKHFDVADDDADVQNYLKRYLMNENDQGQFLKNLPSNFDTKAATEIEGTVLSADEIEKLKFKVDPDDAQIDIDPDDLVESPGLPNILVV